MKRLIKSPILLLFVCFLIGTHNVQAKVIWESGDFNSFFGAKQIPVYLNYSKAVFAGSGDMSDFMLMAERDNDWETENIKEFNSSSNEEVAVQGWGFRFVSPDKALNPTYNLTIEIQQIERNGHIHGNIYLTDAASNQPIMRFTYKSDDADAYDDDMFKDQLESIGESFGKLLKKQMKKALKNNPN